MGCRLVIVAQVHLDTHFSSQDMKFGKQLRGIVECSYPEWQPNFMCYKELKKHIVPRDGLSDSTHADEADGDVSMTAVAGTENVASGSSATPAAGNINDSAEFLAALQKELDKVNDFFLEKQEDFVIEHRELSARVQRLLVPGAATRNEVNRLRQRLIDFHGQLVILENYSTVNYTGFRKILKKHDKKTGLSVQGTALRNLATTPFFASDVTHRMLLTTERQIAELNQVQKFRRATSATDLPELPNGPSTYAVPALGLMTLAPLEPSQAAASSMQVPDDTVIDSARANPNSDDAAPMNTENPPNFDPSDNLLKRGRSFRDDASGSLSE